MRRASLTSSVRCAAGALALVGFSSASSIAQADIPPGLQASMTCVVEGKAVVCHVTAKPTPQSHVTYSRADVVTSPAFLKTLVGSVDYSDGRDRQPRLNLAFMAKTPGSGDIVVKVQAMVCADDGSSCPAVIKAVTAKVTVK